MLVKGVCAVLGLNSDSRAIMNSLLYVYTHACCVNLVWVQHCHLLVRIRTARPCVISPVQLTVSPFVQELELLTEQADLAFVPAVALGADCPCVSETCAELM